MSRASWWMITLLVLVGFPLGGLAQPVPMPQVISNDPIQGPICAGPLGPGPCEAVRRYLMIQMAADRVPVQVLHQDPVAGPICAGPLGPGRCRDVQVYIASQQVANQTIPLTVINNVPGVGPICAGPLGPGPCEAVRLYLLQNQTGTLPFQQFNPQQAQLVANTAVGPTCAGPIGPMPCNLMAQMSLDRAGMAPIPAGFAVPSHLPRPEQRAAECARRTRLDVMAFAACTGQEVVLPKNLQAVLDCAVSNSGTPGFARCAAPNLGMRLSDDQRKLAGCAMEAEGDADDFARCAGGKYLQRSLTDEEEAILDCASQAMGDDGDFISCAAGNFLAHGQKQVVDCALSAGSAVDFATCAAPNAGIKFSNDQRIVAKCALESDGDRDTFAACAGRALLGSQLGQREQALLNCAAQAGGDAGDFAGCAAAPLVGGKLSREQQVALRCAAQSQGDVTQMGVCAGANMFNLQLNPEQQIAVQCVVSTGGQPYAAAGCIASRLTARELTKCLTDGIGGKGCFGDNNDLVGRNGWVMRNLRQVAGGPNSIVNNPDQIWGGDNSFIRNPTQILGGNNSFVRNPAQLWGGANSVFNNPGQLLSSPRPLQVGSIGGKRICLPWC